MGWKNWSAIPRDREGKIAQQLKGDRPKEALTIASLPRADADRMFAQIARQDQEERRKKNESFGAAAADFYTLIGQLLAETFSEQLAQVATMLIETNRSLATVLGQLTVETRENNRLLRQLLEGKALASTAPAKTSDRFPTSL